MTIPAVASRAAQSTELLASAGRALYGDEWQAPFARALGVNPRTLRGWLAGKGEPHPDVLRRAHDLLSRHAHAVLAARADIREFLK
jgi:hypothetical protein